MHTRHPYLWALGILGVAVEAFGVVALVALWAASLLPLDDD